MSEILTLSPLPSKDLGYRPYSDWNTQGEELRYNAQARRLLPVYATFGTTGNPQPESLEDWRASVKSRFEEIAGHIGMKGLELYNPLIRDRQWEPRDAVAESYMFARAETKAIPVLNYTPGEASLAETGWDALSALLRGQQSYQYIESGSGHGERIQQARAMATMLMDATLTHCSINITHCHDLEDLRERSIHGFIDRSAASRGSMVGPEERRIPIHRNHGTLAARILLTGSGASDPCHVWHHNAAERLARYQVPKRNIFSTYKKAWSMEKDAANELRHKTHDAVILSAIMESEASIAAVSELGWLATHAFLTGQSLGIYMERHNSDLKSAPNRQRILTMSHLSRLLQDFPALPIYVANSLDDLVGYGASQLHIFQQQQHISK